MTLLELQVKSAQNELIEINKHLQADNHEKFIDSLARIQYERRRDNLTRDLINYKRWIANCHA